MVLGPGWQWCSAPSNKKSSYVLSNTCICTKATKLRVVLKILLLTHCSLPPAANPCWITHIYALCPSLLSHLPPLSYQLVLNPSFAISLPPLPTSPKLTSQLPARSQSSPTRATSALVSTTPVCTHTHTAVKTRKTCLLRVGAAYGWRTISSHDDAPLHAGWRVLQ